MIFATVTIAAPLCSDTIDTAGGSLPNRGKPVLISKNAVKEFQLALFLENLELSYFQGGLENVTHWGISKYLANTVEIIGKIAAVNLNIDIIREI
jgi:hypothetical protein